MLPYFDFLEAHMVEFRDNARRLYGCRGIHVPSRASTHGWNNHFDATWPMKDRQLPIGIVVKLPPAATIGPFFRSTAYNLAD